MTLRTWLTTTVILLALTFVHPLAAAPAKGSDASETNGPPARVTAPQPRAPAATGAEPAAKSQEEAPTADPEPEDDVPDAKPPASTAPERETPRVRGAPYRPVAPADTVWNALAEDPEVEVLYYAVPLPDDDNFDIPFGFEVAVQSWINERYGARVSIGYQRWAVGGDSLNYYGTAQVIPLGLGLMVSIPEQSDLFGVRGNVGISYKIVSGDLSYGGIDLDYGNAIGAHVGITTEVTYWKEWPILFSLGYQLDVSASSPGNGSDSSEFSQQGLYISLGLRRWL